ncbi:hypothetical protein CRM22_009508 [Opisthorchis felineus]|uniref:Vesicle transport protein USE1 n=1 Tax=Opisthorchis felineus TaxID=147828 RepID=A0A4V3SCZ5_OPIFE|nr:hypothetical protein CRM22_009508 [Opisthorchis felineus]TGZ58704.1 hypothetical protein CRM22_009508 [Opisthorchis felineus]
MSCTIEMNFARLLHHTEDLATAEKANEMRFERYLAALQKFLRELLGSEQCPPAEYIRHYQSRLKQLELARELALSVNPEQRNLLLKSPAIPLIPRPVQDMSLSLTTNPSAPDDGRTSSVNPQKREMDGGVEIAQGALSICGYIGDGPSLFKREQKLQDRENREHLLGLNSNRSSPEPHKLSSPDEPPEKQRVTRSQLLRKEEDHREELASEMLGMARQLKEQSTAMSHRLQSDRHTVEATIQQADRNTADMSKVLQQLSEELGSRCARIVWIALFIALVLFFQMIAFMKLFRKRTRPAISKDEL